MQWSTPSVLRPLICIPTIQSKISGQNGTQAGQATWNHRLLCLRRPNSTTTSWNKVLPCIKTVNWLLTQVTHVWGIFFVQRSSHPLCTFKMSSSLNVRCARHVRFFHIINTASKITTRWKINTSLKLVYISRIYTCAAEWMVSPLSRWMKVPV